MKIRELFQEAISFSRYKNQVIKEIIAAIESCFNDLILDNYEYSGFDFIKSNDTDQIKLHLKPVINQYLKDTLKYHIERNLSALAKKIIGDTGSRYRVSLRIVNIPSDASADSYNNLISLSENTYNLLCDRITSKFVNIVFTWWNHGSILEFITGIIKDSRSFYVDILIEEYEDSFHIHDLVKDYASIFIHELVHVKQHVLQKIQGKTQTQYRSYLQKTPQQFEKSFQRDPQGELLDPATFYRLHRSSPQEIGSFVNQIAIKIIDDMDLLEDDPLGLLQTYAVASGGLAAQADEYRVWNKHLHDSILEEVKKHLSSSNILPNTPKEKMIYRRYIKGVYLEIQRYIQYLINNKPR